MPRSNGRYPAYASLDIDPDLWPNNYWSSSLVCTKCELRWPNTHLFQKSICCESPTMVDTTSAPDIRWPDAVKRLLHSRFDAYYEEWNEGRTDEELAKEQFAKEATGADVDALVDDLTRSAA